MCRHGLIDGFARRISNEKLLSGNTNALAAMFPIDLGDVCLQPRAVALELLVLQICGLDFLASAGIFEVNGNAIFLHIRLLRVEANQALASAEHRFAST